MKNRMKKVFTKIIKLLILTAVLYASLNGWIPQITTPVGFGIAVVFFIFLLW